MGEVKEINIKNQTYYFFDDMIDIRNFHSNLLKIDKKSYKGIDIYYIGYMTIEKFSDRANIHSVNPLYLIIHSATGVFREKNGEKQLIIDSTEKYEEIFSEIKSEVKTLDGGKKLLYEKNYAKIGVNTDDDLPLNKQIKFPTLTIFIRCVFQEGEKLYPQIYLDECLCELLKCSNTIELMFQKELTLIKQVNQKNVCFIIIGTLKTLVKNFSHIFVMVAMLCQ